MDACTDPSEQSGFAGLNVGKVSKLLAEVERDGANGSKVGSDEVRGVPTVHYRFEAKTRVLPDQVEAMALITSEDITVDIWADDELRLRRIRYESARDAPRRTSSISARRSRSRHRRRPGERRGVCPGDG